MYFVPICVQDFFQSPPYQQKGWKTEVFLLEMGYRTGEMFTNCVLLLLKINEELFALFGMKQIVLSYPQTDDVNERMSKTIKTFLNKYCIDHPNDWDEHLSAIAFAFNLTNLVCQGSSSFD